MLALQRMLGHNSAKLTLDTYADLFDDDLDRVAEALEAARPNSKTKILRKLSPFLMMTHSSCWLL